MTADQEDLIDSLKRKEQKLMTDQKKRSEAARELVVAKDKEIEELRAQVQLASSSKKHAGTASPTVDGQLTPSESPVAVNLAAVMQSEQELVDLRSKNIELTAYINELNRANDEFKLENDSLKLSTEDLKAKIITMERERQKDKQQSLENFGAQSSLTGTGSIDSDIIADTPLSKYAQSLVEKSVEESFIGEDAAEATVNREDELIEHVTYLRQAFCRFVKARDPVEMQHCGRVMCAILSLPTDEQTVLMENILRISELITPSVVDSITSSIFSFYS